MIAALAGTAKIMLGLSLALALSAGGNAWQLYRAGVQQGETAGARERQALAAANAGFRQAQAVNEALAGQSIADRAQLLADLTEVAERARAVRVIYRTAATATPLARGCAPGTQRMDAVNQGLGPGGAP